MTRLLLVGLLVGGCAFGDDDGPGGGTPRDGSPLNDGKLVDARPYPDARMFPDGVLPPDSPPPPDAPPPVMCGTVGPDLCAGAMDLTTAASAAGGMTLNGDTTGLASNLSPPTTCTGFSNPAPDAMYQVTATTGQTISVSLRADWDSAIYIASACMDANCVAGADSTVFGTETTSFTVATAGTYFIVIDGYDEVEFGCYELHVALM